MSRFEGVPISILEARQHGLPLVLTDIPGHRDGAGTSPATFTAVDDVKTFAQHLQRLLEPPVAQPSPTPDTARLAQDWQQYSEAFLTIVAQAAAHPTPIPAVARA